MLLSCDQSKKLSLVKSIVSDFVVISALTLDHKIPTFNDHEKERFWKTPWEKENAGNQHFFLSPQCFLLFQGENSSFQQHLIRRLQMLSIWSYPKLLFGKGFTT